MGAYNAHLRRLRGAAGFTAAFAARCTALMKIGRPNVNHWIVLAAAITAEVVATSALKASQGFSRPGWSALVIVGYATAFWLLAQTLRTLPIGTAYAVWSGAGTALIALVGWLFFRQSLDLPALVGIGLIIAGVLVLNLWSASAPH
jgi:small multidrug resistance pump